MLQYKWAVKRRKSQNIKKEGKVMKFKDLNELDKYLDDICEDMEWDEEYWDDDIQIKY